MTELSKDELQLFEILEGLHKLWIPHDGQVPIGHALFYEGFKNIFVCAGRNFGKTELAAYITWRWARQNPGSQNYIFEPYAKQAREILWASNRIQQFGPNSWILGINITEMRITFKNGSFIKLEGSDNETAMAGIKPKGIIIYDEFKDHRIKSVSNFEPNRAAHNVPALFIGTPPEFHNHFIDYMELARKFPDRWAYFHAPTSTNPHISVEWLNNKKEEMLSMGEEEAWLREYEAIYVKGGKRSIFPQFLKKPRPSFGSIKPKDLNKWTIIVSHDPASTSIFGAVFLLFNPWSKQVIAFDELYVDKPELMTAGEIYKAVNIKLKPLAKLVRDIRYVYDEAAAWFRNEVNAIENSTWWLEQSEKSEFGIDGYVGLVRAFLNKDLLTVCSECPKLIWELDGYIKDEKGRIPKENDHNINSLQYGLAATGLRFEEDHEPVIIQKEERRGFSVYEELPTTNSFQEID
jgi:hypothetical protein